jgi:hypothetical protein
VPQAPEKIRRALAPEGMTQKPHQILCLHSLLKNAFAKGFVEGREQCAAPRFYPYLQAIRTRMPPG